VTVSAPSVMPRSMEVGSGEVLLDARSVSKAFGAVQALRDVSLEVREREVVGLIGPNGSGKTTFFNCVSGFERIQRGSITWRGRNVGGWPPQRLARHGLVRTFQHVMLFPDSPIVESIRYAAECVRSWGRSEACLVDLPTEPAEIAELAGLDPSSKTPVDSLPHGTQRIVGVAMALAARPTLLMLDEPAAGLHQGECDALATLLLRLRGIGLASLVIDHHMPFLLSVCDRVSVIDAGTNLVEGSPAEVQAHPDVIRIYLGDRTDGRS
jgi:ABC-type branched-subunit amino acid transport system ATPase component